MLSPFLLRPSAKFTEIDLPFGAVLLALLDQERALRGGERLAEHALSLAAAGLLQIPLGGGGGVLGVDVAERGVDGGRAEAGPEAVEAAGAERRVLGLAEPDGPGVRGALGVAEAEVEGEVGVGGWAAAAVQRGRRPVGGLLGPALLGGGVVGDFLRGGFQGVGRHEAVAVEEAGEVAAGRVARPVGAAEEAGDEEHGVARGRAERPLLLAGSAAPGDDRWVQGTKPSRTLGCIGGQGSFVQVNIACMPNFIWGK